MPEEKEETIEEEIRWFMKETIKAIMDIDERLTKLEKDGETT